MLTPDRPELVTEIGARKGVHFGARKGCTSVHEKGTPEGYILYLYLSCSTQERLKCFMQGRFEICRWTGDKSRAQSGIYV